MKRIPADAKIVAYNDAISFLESLETDHDTEDEKRARKWLSDKLNREADRLASIDSGKATP